MPEPVSTLSLIAGYTLLAPLCRSGSAVSAEAHAVARQACEVRSSSERSLALFGVKAEAISQLLTLAAECAEADWDGCGASAIRREAVDEAAELVRSLPDGMPMPEFCGEPDGAVSLDWIGSKTRLLSVSVNGSRRLAYAAMDSSSRNHGVERFDGQSLPEVLQFWITRILPHERAAIRTA